MKYALALGGGGTRGAFQVGVYKALCELGLEIVAITGTSIGAVNGAVFASGVNGEYFWQNIEAKDVADIDGNNLFSPKTLISSLKKASDGGIDFSAFSEFLSGVISEEAVRAGGIDYGLCTYRTDTKKSCELFLNDIPTGKLIQYILASAAFPLFKPVTIDNVTYTDGGVANNLPENMLIDRGYDTIISVSVKGPGITKSIDQSGINIIDINYDNPQIGVMDFNTEAISESIIAGYFRCMRVFGKYCGNIFPIEPSSYNHALSAFGPDILSGLERAGQLCKLDKYQVYTVKSLLDAVLSKYKSNHALNLMVKAIQSDMPGRGVLDSLGKTFHGANAIVYLKKHMPKL